MLEKDNKNTTRILLIEDNKNILVTLPILLESLGCDVHTAQTGSEGIAKAVEHSPNVVLLDLGLPDMSGIEVAIELRKLTTPFTIVAVTGFDKPALSHTDSQVIDFWLKKPVSIKEISNILSELCPTS